MGLTQVTGKGITDGTIFDVDVHASAAIAGSKISPNFGSQDIFGKNIILTSSTPTVNFTSNTANPDHIIQNLSGNLRFHDSTNSVDRLIINSDGHVDIAGNLDVGAGIDVTGEITATSHIDLPDDAKIKLGTSDDLQIEHDGSASFIGNSTGVLGIQSDELHLTSKTGGEPYLKGFVNGAVELYHDNSKKFETTSTGIKVNPIVTIDGSTPRIEMKPTADVQSHRIEFYNAADSMVSRIYGDPSTGNLEIQTGSGGNETSVKCIANGAVELYHDNTKMFETTADGATLQKGLTVRGIEGGEAQIRIEADEADNATDRFRLVATDSAGFHIQSYDGSQYDTLFKGVMNGGAELYYNNSKKFETTSSGATVTGNLTVSGSLTNGVTATTQSAGDNSTKVATTAYTDTAIANLADSAPSTLNTLNELAAALGDDANFSTTVTNSIATKMALAGGTFTGDVTFDGATAGRDILFDRSRDSLVFKDNAVAEFGDSNDLQIYHTGSNSIIQDTGAGDLIIKTNIFRVRGTNDEAIITGSQDGNVALYHDNSKKFETTSSGVSITGTCTLSSHLLLGDSDEIKVGSGEDLLIYHNGTNSYLQNSTGNFFVETSTGDLYLKSSGDDVHIRAADNVHIENQNGSEKYALFEKDGSVELYYDNSKKVETTSSGIDITGKIKATSNIEINADNMELRVGASDDFKISHSSSENINILRSNSPTVFRNEANNETLAKLTPNGSVELYYDNSKKLETTSSGVNVTGALTINGAALGGGNPTGTVISYAGSSAPTGYLKANGDSIPNGSGTVQGVTEDFSDLYAIVGSSLPDLRGEFVRGLDDGRGVDSGRSIRSSQGNQNLSHSHTTNTTLNHNNNNSKDLQGQFNGEERDGRPFGVFYTVGGRGRDFDGGDGDYIGFDGRHRHGTTSNGGSEARPRNVALLMCIKY